MRQYETCKCNICGNEVEVPQEYFKREHLS